MIRCMSLLTLILLARSTIAAPPATQPAPAARAETAIDLALLHLERRQHADGHFQSDPKLALTALALTSYLATGNAPDHGRHGGTVRRAVDYLVRSAPDDGYFGKIDGGRMYGQAIVVMTEDGDGLFQKVLSRGLVRPDKEGPVHQGPTDQTWGTREFYIDDPDGNTLRFTQSGR